MDEPATGIGPPRLLVGLATAPWKPNPVEPFEITCTS
jgi:hypothetical protein